MLSGEMPDEEDGYTSRPRRCWFLPTTVSSEILDQWYARHEEGNPDERKEGAAHTLLTVV